MRVTEVIVVIDETERQTLDDESRKLCARSAPLLLRISLDQLLIDITAYQLQRLLFEILRLVYIQIPDLARNDCLGFSRCADIPHSGKRVHVERKIIKLIFIDSDRTVDEIIERDELINELPHFLI